MNQVLANAGSVTLTQTWYQSGTPTDVGDVTIGIVDGNGAVVVAAGTATSNDTGGVYTYTLADQANPKLLVATWTDTTSGDTRVDRLEVLGNWLFTENQARTFAAKADATTALKPLASSTEYPDDTISDERSRLTDDFESWTGRSWVPRYARVELSGNGGSVLSLRDGFARTSDGYQLHRPGRLNDIAVLLTVTVGGTAVDVADIEIDETAGRVIHTTSVWTAATITTPFNVIVEYVYGLPYIVDGVDRIALKVLVDRLVPSAWPDKALSADTEYGTTRFIQPGGPMSNRTSIAEVNDWITTHNMKVLVG
jgi:hypothetical protein